MNARRPSEVAVITVLRSYVLGEAAVHLLTILEGKEPESRQVAADIASLAQRNFLPLGFAERATTLDLNQTAAAEAIMLDRDVFRQEDANFWPGKVSVRRYTWNTRVDAPGHAAMTALHGRKSLH